MRHPLLPGAGDARKVSLWTDLEWICGTSRQAPVRASAMIRSSRVLGDQESSFTAELLRCREFFVFCTDDIRIREIRVSNGSIRTHPARISIWEDIQ